MKLIITVIIFLTIGIAASSQTKCINMDSLYALEHTYDRLGAEYYMLNRVTEGIETWAQRKEWILTCQYYDNLSNEVNKLIRSLLPPDPPFIFPSRKEVQIEIDRLKRLIPKSKLYKP